MVTYYTVDDCGNSATCQMNLTVADLTVPVAICDEITTVDVSSGGEAAVLAETFDDGSYDDCCLSHFEVAFALQHDGKTLFNVKPATSELAQEQRIATLIGKKFLQNSLHIDMETAGLQLWGWVGLPTYSRSS